MTISCFFLVVMVAFLVLCERKWLRRIQGRSRPLVVRWLGLLTTLGDGVKLVRKEIIFIG